MSKDSIKITYRGQTISFNQYKQIADFDKLQSQFDSGIEALFALDEDIKRQEALLEDQKAHRKLIKEGVLNLDIQINQLRKKMIIQKEYPRFLIELYSGERRLLYNVEEVYEIYSLDLNIVELIAKEIRRAQGYHSYKIIRKNNEK